MIQIDTEYVIQKQWLSTFISELAEIITRRQLTNSCKIANYESSVKNHECDDQARCDKKYPEFCSSSEAAENKSEKDNEKFSSASVISETGTNSNEHFFKSLERKLFNEFESSKHPHWLVLILVENCRDYIVNKYNTIACLIVRSFEKWTSMRKTTKGTAFRIDDEIKKAAFITSTRYHIILLNHMIKPYELESNSEIMLPLIKYKAKTMDHKDKAMIISMLELHDHFDFEEVRVFFIKFNVSFFPC